jgi:hypothetical protein
MLTRLRTARARYRGRDTGEFAAERDVPPARQRVPVDRTRVLAPARLQRGVVGDVQQLTRSRRAAVPARPRPRELAFLLVHLHGPGRVGVHLRLRHAAYLVAASVGARDPVHAERARQLALHRGSRDGLQGAEDPTHAHGVQGQPLPVAERPGDPGDLIVNVILGITVPAGALQPGRDDQPGGLEPARLAPVDPGAVVTAAGDPGPSLQVLQRRPVGPVQDLLEHRLPAGPVRGGLLVAGLAGAALVLPDRGM